MDAETIKKVTATLTANALIGALEAVASALQIYTDPEVQELAQTAERLAYKKQLEADKVIAGALKLGDADIWELSLKARE